MRNEPTEYKFFISILVGILGIGLVIPIDVIYLQKHLLQKGDPVFDTIHLTRSIIIFLSVLGILYGLVGKKRPVVQLFGLSDPSTLDLGRFGTHALAQSGIFVAYVGSALALLLGLIWPVAFNALSNEDHLLEWASAVLLFAAALIFLITFLKFSRSQKTSKSFRMVLFLYFLLFFVVAMEEVSWFQRVVDFETPDAFAKNDQGEFNLHNFFTGLAENLYYFGSFVLLIVSPFVGLLYPNAIKDSSLKMAIPRPFIIVIAAAASSFSFDMWNIVFTQIGFFGSILILAAITKLVPLKSEKKVLLLIIGFLLVQQLIFVVNPGIIDPTGRYWTLTEYREFFLPLAFFVFSLDVFKRTKRLIFAKQNTGK